MNKLARAKHNQAVRTALTVLDEATVIKLPGFATRFALTVGSLGAGPITSLRANRRDHGIVVSLFHAGGGTLELTNTNGPTVEWQMDLGGSNLTLSIGDRVDLELQANGTWLRHTVIDN